MNAHADMLIVVSTQRIKHIKGHLSLSCFGLVKVSSFQIAKTSTINAFHMSAKPRSGGSILFDIVLSSSILSFCPMFAVQRYNKICAFANFEWKKF